VDILAYNKPAHSLCGEWAVAVLGRKKVQIRLALIEIAELWPYSSKEVMSIERLSP
jgi:hypothetical protein